MDEAARKAFRARWREKHRRRPDAQPHLQGHRRRASPAAASSTTCRCSSTQPGDDLRLPRRRQRSPALVLHGEVDEALRALLDRHARAPPLPAARPRAADPAAGGHLPARPRSSSRRTQAHATLALRGSDAEVDVGAAAARPERRPRRHRAAGPAGTPLDDTPHRVLLVAESDGRRESLLELLRDHRIGVPSVDSLAEFEAGDEKVAIATAPLAAGFFWFEPERAGAIQFVTETELFATTPQARRRRKQEQVSSVDALIKDLSELKVGDPVVHLNHGIGRYRAEEHRPAAKARQRVPAPRIRRQGDAVRAGGAAAPDQPLHRRQRRRSAAAPAGLARSGTRRGARPPSRCATPPPNC